jgi:penicillin amidase
VTIYRDTYGVPHIYGPTDASCVFGYAYAQAEDNFWQVEDSYLRALGRAAEVYGKKTLDDDLVYRFSKTYPYL